MRHYLLTAVLLVGVLTGCVKQEKKPLNALTAELSAAIAQGATLEGFQMLDMLNKQGLSLLVYNDRVLTTHQNRGVADLLQLISEHPERLKGAVVADKIIGKAAAAIMATGGVKEVHTNIICTPARELFEKEGILVFATEEVAMILNRDKSSMCPIDTRLEGIESIEECVQILQNMPPVL